MDNPQLRQGEQHERPPHHQAQDESNKITPELLVDALSGHEEGLLSIAERLMTHYDSGYDTMGEAIIDAFSDVQKLFQHVVEAAHMEGAALERERGEGEWRRRMESLGLGNDVEKVLYGQLNDTLDESGGVTIGVSPSGGKGDYSGGASDEDHHRSTLNSNHDHSTPAKSTEEHRHEELIDQDVRDVLIDAIKRGQSHRDAKRFAGCRALYEAACGNASSLLPVDSDHRGRLQLAVARAESMSADRACAILKYAMDDVLRSGLSLRQGMYPQMDVNERSDCVLSRPNPLRSTPSRGYDINQNFHSSSGGPLEGGEISMVEQSAEEALNSLVEEMKEILGAPVYNQSPLQSVSEKFWVALGQAKKAGTKKEERLEQALAKIKADYLLAREEFEEQLSEERNKNEILKRRFNDMRFNENRPLPHNSPNSPLDNGTLPTAHRSSATHSVTSGEVNGSCGGGGTVNNNIQNHHNFAGMDRASPANNSPSFYHRNSNQSVVSMGSEFAQRAKSFVHLLNCQGKEVLGPKVGRPETARFGNDNLDYGRHTSGTSR